MRRRRRLSRLRSTLAPNEWRRIGLLALAILGLHALGLLLALAAASASHRHGLGHSAGFGLGLAITAYSLGLRHAFDADHVGAIDNTTRKLMREGQRPLSVGFFFSLGHSTVVFALAALVAAGVHGLGGAVHHGSALQGAGGLIGPAISGTFLLVIGTLNLLILINIVSVFRRMRHGDYDERELERELDSRGLVGRFFGVATRGVRSPWQMYPVGLLFGLGFDTASEVALLVLAGAGAASGLPFYAILCLPLLFAAGMSLLDTIDGAFMNFAYGWAFSKPVRKVFYNIAITGLSVAVALLIGMLQFLSVLPQQLGLNGSGWRWVSTLDLNLVGYAVVGMFVLTWIIALAVWRIGRIEERWDSSLPRT
jgi:high-affinity nickel-transport protein